MMKQVVGAAALALLTAGCSAFGSNHASGGSAAPAMSGGSMPPAASANASHLAVTKDTVKQIQSVLQQQGLYNGAIDGIVGPRTRTALANYQQRQGQNKSPVLDQQTLQALLTEPQPQQQSGSSTPPGARMSSDQIRRSLQSDGYSDVSDIRPWGNQDYTARASKDGQTHTVEINGRTGQVMSQQ